MCLCGAVCTGLQGGRTSVLIPHLASDRNHKDVLGMQVSMVVAMIMDEPQPLMQHKRDASCPIMVDRH